MRAGFGEAAFANVFKGKAYLIFLREILQCCLAGRYVRNSFVRGRGQSGDLTVEAFVLSGSYALSVHEGQAHSLFLG